jgi:Rhs element Vgr protein
MSVVTTTILSNGQRMDPAYEVLSIDISQEVNRISYAQLILLDGDAAQQQFPISDSDFFEPGNKLEIKLRYEDAPTQEKTVFKGVVIKQSVEADLAGSRLTVELKDEAVKLTRGRKSQVYRDQTDDKVIAKMISDSGLAKGTIPATQIKHPELVQYYCSDWDFILARAESLGLLVVTTDGKITLSEIAIKGQPKHTFEYGISEIFNFEIEADAEHQYPDIQSIAWDIKTQKLTKAAKAKDFTLSQSNLKAASIAKTIGIESNTLNNPVPLEPKELQAWSDATMTKTRMAMLRGRLSVPGDADIKLLDLMKVAGIGQRFNGKTLVTGIRHRVDQQGWVTDVQFGLPAERFAEQAAIIDTPAAGLLPAVNGLQIGVVSKFEADPAKEFRVKVILPGIDEKKGAVWARLASLDAGKNRGYVFWPEAGDEVIVGFFNDDPRQAVILGAMYSSKNTPPDKVAQPSEKNIDKAIVTKTGISIKFIDEKKPALLIETPNSNKIVLDEDAKMIQIVDQHNNSITMNQEGIEIKSAKDVKIDAKGNVEIKGQKVDVK